MPRTGTAGIGTAGTGRRTGPTAGQEPCIQLGQRRIKLRRRRIEPAPALSSPGTASRAGRSSSLSQGSPSVEIVRVDQAVRASGFHLGHERRQRRLLIPVVIDATQPRRGLLLVRPRPGWGLRGTFALRVGLRLPVSPGLRRFGPRLGLGLGLGLGLEAEAEAEAEAER